MSFTYSEHLCVLKHALTSLCVTVGLHKNSCVEKEKKKEMVW
jgi:hypothetical protein